MRGAGAKTEKAKSSWPQEGRPDFALAASVSAPRHSVRGRHAECDALTEIETVAMLP